MNQIQEITVTVLTVLGSLYVTLSAVALATFLPKPVRDSARFLALDIASLSKALGKPMDTTGLTPDAVKALVHQVLDARIGPFGVSKTRLGESVWVSSEAPLASTWPAAKPIGHEDTLVDLPKTEIHDVTDGH